MSRITRPVCATHGVEMVAHLNGHMVVTIVNGNPYEMWAGDEYKCPIGSERVVVSFGNQPVWAERENRPLKVAANTAIYYGPPYRQEHE